MKSSPSRRHLLVAALFWLAAAAAMTNADAGSISTSPAPVLAPAPAATEPVMLGIIGFNYTNHYIDQFYVNDKGGGNLYVSTPTSGGGGTTCCVRYRPGSSLPVKVHVRWSAAACTYPYVEPGVGSYIKPRKVERIRHFFKEADVLISGPIPPDPQNMEIHFYPDGHVEAAITAAYSSPRLRLESSREVEAYPACTAAEIPEEDKP